MCEKENSIFPFAGLLPVAAAPFSALREGLLPCRAASRLPASAKSVIVYLFPYFLGESAYENSNLSSYAVPADYHVTVSGYLEKAAALLLAQHPENHFVPFCDNSPLPEVEAAVTAGLGSRGKNSLLLNKEYGSYCFIGEIVTDLTVPYGTLRESLCTGCNACVTACPAGAISENGIDRTSCLSAVSQRKGELTEEEKRLLRQSGCVWGCDICQQACPVNRAAAVTPIPEFRASARGRYCAGDSLEGRAYAWRGEQPIRRNFEIMCCNSEENPL